MKRDVCFAFSPGDFVHVPAHQLDAVVQRCAIDAGSTTYYLTWLDPGCQIAGDWFYEDEIQLRGEAAKKIEGDRASKKPTLYTIDFDGGMVGAQQDLGNQVIDVDGELPTFRR